MVRSCPICKSEQCEKLLKRKLEYPGSDLQSNLLDIDYVRNSILFDRIIHNREPVEFCFKICTRCGLIFFSPRPEENDMVIKYNITSELGDVEEREKFRYKITYDDQRALEVYKSICSIREVHDSNVIDIGGGHGLNMKYFLGDNACFVVDYLRQELLDGTRYLCKTTKNMPDSMRCELVLYCHTLEHVVDLVRAILEIKDILQPGGLLYIEVPFGCWNEYKNTKNFLTHINFFSEGSLRYLLDVCDLSVRYLKLRPTLARKGYGLVIVAIAENSPPHRKATFDAYQITRNQMNGRHLGLRAHTLFLNARLMKFRFLTLLANYLRQRL